MFSALSDWVTTAADAVTKISDQSLDAVRQTGLIDALQNAAAQSDAAATSAAPDQSLSAQDLMTPPAAWVGSSDEWRWCVEAALTDANTCAITPSQLKRDDNLWQEINTTLRTLHTSGSTAAAPESGSDAAAAEAAAALMEKTDLTFSPAADIIAYVQGHAAVYAVRSYVVPLFTSDEDYWLNLGWRLSLYKLCHNAGELLRVMRTLSKLPAQLHDIADAERRAVDEAAARRASAAAAKKAKGADDGEDDDEEWEEEEEYVPRPHLKDSQAFWDEMHQQHEAEQEKFAWLRETQERVKKEMELARGNVKLLDSLLQRQESSSALGVSVSDSCKYHKVKLSRLIGDISAAPEEHTRGTVLDTATGALFHELFQCNEAVKNVLDACAGRGQGGGSPKVLAASTSSPLPSPVRHSTAPRDDAAASQPSVENAVSSPPQAAASVASSSAVELSAGGSVDNAAAELKADGSEHNGEGDDDDDDEGSFEAKLPWSMDD